MPVKTGAAFEHGQPRRLWEGVPIATPFQISPDGQRILALQTDEQTARLEPLTVIVHREATLKN